MDLDRRRLQPPELEAPATGLINNIPAVRRDVAQRVDLIVMLAVGKGGDFGKESFQPGQSVREAHQAVVEVEQIWNRMSSGTYFPPPVRAVSIPKKSGGERILGVPTVSDRIAQMVVKQLIEPDLDPIFLPDFLRLQTEKIGAGCSRGHA